MRKKHLIAVTAFAGAVVTSIGALAAFGGQEEAETDISMWKTSDGGYDYPVDALGDE